MSITGNVIRFFAVVGCIHRADESVTGRLRTILCLLALKVDITDF